MVVNSASLFGSARGRNCRWLVYFLDKIIRTEFAGIDSEMLNVGFEANAEFVNEGVFAGGVG